MNENLLLSSQKTVGRFVLLQHIHVARHEGSSLVVLERHPVFVRCRCEVQLNHRATNLMGLTFAYRLAKREPVEPNILPKMYANIVTDLSALKEFLAEGGDPNKRVWYWDAAEALESVIFSPIHFCLCSNNSFVRRAFLNDGRTIAEVYTGAQAFEAHGCSCGAFAQCFCLDVICGPCLCLLLGLSRPCEFEGFPLVIWAILADRVEAVELLLAANADVLTQVDFERLRPPSDEENYRFTPLELAEQLKRSTAMLMMLEVAEEFQNSDSSIPVDTTALQRAIEARKAHSKVAAIAQDNIASELLRCGSSPALVNKAAISLFELGYTDLSKLVYVEADDLIKGGYTTAEARMIVAKLKQGAVPVAEMVRES
jgi:hypothetical protein